MVVSYGAFDISPHWPNLRREVQMDDEINVEKNEDAGRRGGAASYAQGGAYVAPTERAVQAVIELGNVRWGAIWAGFVLAFGVQLILESLVIAILITVGRGAANATALGILTAAVAFVALISGGWVTGRMAKAGSAGGVMHAALLWGLMVTLATVAVAFGATSILGSFMSTAGPAAAGTRHISVSAAWWWFISIAVALIGTLIGGQIGGSRSENIEPTQ